MNAEGEIRPLRPEEVLEAAALVRESFATVAEEFGITEENAPRFTAFAVTAERLRWQMEQGKWRGITLWTLARGMPAS